MGGGNHFIEVDVDEENNYYLLIHSGSRNFGLKVASIFQFVAKHLMESFAIKVPKDLEYLPKGYGMELYLDYMGIAQKFAELNRKIILKDILFYFKIDYSEEELISSVHNYIDLEQRIIRKGAIKCMKDMKCLIPLNMRDGTIIGHGKDNALLENWNFSMPHGAGRVMGRNEAKKNLKMEDFKKEMNGIWSSSINESTLDEAPMAYKDKNIILDSIKDVFEIEKIIKPVYNLKASE